jgi:hypothetical protein
MKSLLVYVIVLAVVVSGCASSGSSPSTPGKDLPTAGDGSTIEAPKSVKEWMNSGSRKKKKAVKGGILGALGGAGLALIKGKNPLEGALVGAAVGALAGFLVGQRQDKIHAGRDQAIAKIGWEPEQGYVMQIEEVKFESANLKAGDTTELEVTYIVVGPDPKESITVQAYTGVLYDGDYVMGNGPEEFEVPRGGGIVKTLTTVTIPKEAPTGTYAVEALFEEPQGLFEESQTSPLYVT